MEINCTYYWNKIAISYFADLYMERKLRIAKKYLSKDEFKHLKQLLEE